MPTASNVEFYEATAQLVPLLFIALLVERRLLREERDALFRAGSVFDFLLVCLIAVGLVLAEVLALAALAADDPSDAVAQSIAVIVATAGTALAFTALADVFDASRRAAAPGDRWKISVIGVVATLALGAILLGVILAAGLRLV